MRQAILFLLFFGAAFAQMPTLATGGNAGGGGGNCPGSGSANQIQIYSDSTHCASSPATADSSGNVTGASFTSSDTSHSGIDIMNGKTSGTAAWGVADVAGTAIVYVLPSTNGSANQVLEDTGSTTCPTYVASAPTTCHQLAWTTAGGSPFLYTAGPATAISTPASACGSEPCNTDAIIEDSGALPALAAGKCLRINWVMNASDNTQGNNFVLWIGATARTGATMWHYTSTNTLPIQGTDTICNLAGSQTTQTAYGLHFYNGAAPNISSNGSLTATLSSAFHVVLTNASNNGAMNITTTPISFTVQLLN